MTDFVGLARYHAKLVASTVALVTLLAAIVVFQVPLRYSAQANILVGAPRADVMDIKDVLDGLGSDQAAVESEMRVLTSRALASKVSDELDLATVPEFNAELRPPSLVSRINPIGWLSEEWRNALKGGPAGGTEEDRLQRQRSAVVSAFQDAVSVEVVGRSRVLAVTATSQDPKLAAALANTLSDAYLEDQLEAKFEATKMATAWLNDRVADLRNAVESSEGAVEDYRRQHGIVESKDATVVEQQISEINTQLILARTQSAAANATLRRVESLVGSDAGVESAAEVLASPLILSLREGEADIARRIAEMATEYGPRHPKMVNARAELEDARAKIGVEVTRIVRGLENERAVAETRERSLQESLHALEAESAEINAAHARLRVLEREAVANRTLFDTLLARWNEIGQQGDMQHADARIISRADVPTSPASPNKPLVISVSFVGAILLAVLLVAAVENLDTGLRSSKDVDVLLGGANTLAMVPLLVQSRRGKSPPHTLVLEKPASSFAESLRSLHTGLLIASSRDDAQMRTVLVTSAMPGEGKTTMSLAMARLAAKSGGRVLLIDTDMRTNEIARLLGMAPDRGLAQVLAEECSVTDAVARDEPSGLDVLMGGRWAPNPTDLITSPRMADLLSEVGRRWDIVILDSPPVLVVSDARYLASLVDVTVYVIKWVDTKRDVAMLGYQQIQEVGGHVAGVVLSMVDMRRNARYGNADSAYYYKGYQRKYSHYYAE